MKDFTETATRVWSATTVLEKRDILIAAADDFDHKGKFNENYNRWVHSVNNAGPTKLDQMAANIALNKEFKVIK